MEDHVSLTELLVALRQAEARGDMLEALRLALQIHEIIHARKPAAPVKEAA